MVKVYWEKSMNYFLHLMYKHPVVVRSSLFLALQFVSYTCSHYGEIVTTVYYMVDSGTNFDLLSLIGMMESLDQLFSEMITDTKSK